MELTYLAFALGIVVATALVYALLAWLHRRGEAESSPPTQSTRGDTQSP